MNRITAFLVGAVLGSILGWITGFALSFFIGAWIAVMGRKLLPLAIQIPLYCISFGALIGGGMSLRHFEDRGFSPSWRGAAWGATCGLVPGLAISVLAWMSASAQPMIVGATGPNRGVLILTSCIGYLLGPAGFGTALGAVIGALVDRQSGKAIELQRHSPGDDRLDGMRTFIEERVAPAALESTGPVEWCPAEHPSPRITELTGRYEYTGTGVRASILRPSPTSDDAALHVLFQIRLPALVPDRALPPDRLVLAGVNRKLAEHLACDPVSPAQATDFGSLSRPSWTDLESGITYELELNAHDRIGGAEMGERFIILSADLSHLTVG